ncbi:MAG: hypothetical protein U1F50_01460 [Rubrivivax sp.]
MRLPQSLVVRLSPLVEAARGWPLVEPAIEITPPGQVPITLRSAHGEFVFDPEKRSVSRDGVEVAPFAAIQSIDVGAFPGGRGERSWSITLYLGFLRRVTLGRTYDDGDASVIAARLARATGAKVVATTLLR